VPHHYGWKPGREHAPVIRIAVTVVVVVVVVLVALAVLGH
jgi:hypothetical protein